MASAVRAGLHLEDHLVDEGPTYRCSHVIHRTGATERWHAVLKPLQRPSMRIEPHWVAALFNDALNKGDKRAQVSWVDLLHDGSLHA